MFLLKTYSEAAPINVGSGSEVTIRELAETIAQVVGYQAGKGRLKGLTGALLVETAQGQRFALGTGLSDAQRRTPPPLGTWVTYSYRDRTPSGLPRFASFVRVRDPE